MKTLSFSIRQTIKDLFAYPVYQIREGDVDYDAYWRSKRGSSLGELSTWQRERADLFLTHVDRTSAATVVDVGCGDGSVLGYLKDHMNIERAVGMDVSETALSKAQAGGIDTVKVDVHETNANLVEAEYILLFETLEHTSNPEDLLRYARTKARNGVAFSFPNTGYVKHRARLLFGKFPLQWRTHPGEHLRFWTLKDLKWWLRSQGYTEAQVSSYKGIPVLNKIWPSLFAAGLFVYLPTK